MEEKPPTPWERAEARMDETAGETDKLCREENLIPEATPDYQAASEDPAREECINSTAEKMAALMQSNKKK
ncbi:MAG: hypothetical protein LBH90_05825 [Tannerella sp.]|jgi:hypothetical protein|nr:hypothetical protein [Tannerella sp.]